MLKKAILNPSARPAQGLVGESQLRNASFHPAASTDLQEAAKQPNHMGNRSPQLPVTPENQPKKWKDEFRPSPGHCPDKELVWNIAVGNAKRGLEAGDYTEAINSARVAIVSSNEQDAESFLLAGEATAALGRFDESVYYYTRALNINPRYYVARKSRVESLLALADSDVTALKKFSNSD